jgi:hypothetical protein
MPRRGDRLFHKPNQRTDTFVLRPPLARSGDPTTPVSWLDYASSYRDCADRLIAQKDKWGRAEIYPVIFLYRHSIELALKAVIAKRHLSDRWNDPTPQFKALFQGPDLLALVNQCRTLCEGSRLFYSPNETFESFAGLIKELHEQDERSFAFRYPLDKKLNQTLTQLESIDVIHLQCMMHRCFSYLQVMLEHFHDENVFSASYSDDGRTKEELFDDFEGTALAEESES